LTDAKALSDGMLEPHSPGCTGNSLGHPGLFRAHDAHTYR